MERQMKKLTDLPDTVTACLDIITGDIKKESATVILMVGDLGTGKTTFTQEFARQVGVKDTVTSPTFVIQKEYEISNFDRHKNLVHIDAYRLDGKKDLEYLGWDKLLEDSRNLIILEWPSMVDGINFGLSVYKCELAITPGHERSISFRKIT